MIVSLVISAFLPRCLPVRKGSPSSAGMKRLQWLGRLWQRSPCLLGTENAFWTGFCSWGIPLPVPCGCLSISVQPQTHRNKEASWTRPLRVVKSLVAVAPSHLSISCDEWECLRPVGTKRLPKLGHSLWQNSFKQYCHLSLYFSAKHGSLKSLEKERHLR